MKHNSGKLLKYAFLKRNISLFEKKKYPFCMEVQEGILVMNLLCLENHMEDAIKCCISGLTLDLMYGRISGIPPLK